MANPWGAAVREETAAGPASPVAQAGDRTPAAEGGSGPTLTPVSWWVGSRRRGGRAVGSWFAPRAWRRGASQRDHYAAEAPAVRCACGPPRWGRPTDLPG